MTFDLVSCSAAVQNCLKIGSFFVLKRRALKTLLRYLRIGELQYKDYLLTLFQSKFMKFKARVLRVIVRQQYGIKEICAIKRKWAKRLGLTLCNLFLRNGTSIFGIYMIDDFPRILISNLYIFIAIYRRDYAVLVFLHK